jgi:hypothetical protein
VPVSWDRLADATAAAPQTLSIVTLGHVHADDLNPLTPHFSRLEQLVLDIPPHEPIEKHRAEFNRAVDAASNDWILIIREREVIDDPLAVEIAKAIHEPARGFRIRSVPYYAGKPLRIGVENEIRLFHRRYYMRFAKTEEMSIQGSVVRLENLLRSMTFESAEAHRADLEKRGVPHSGLRHVLLFLRDARTLDRNTLRYLWIEAGFDR